MMQAVVDDELLSVADVAALLGVAASTVRRWIAASQLPAYRVGARQVRVKRGDLALVVAPITPPAAQRRGSDHPIVPPMSDDEQRRWKAAIADMERAHREQLAERGGVPFDSSTPMLAELRAERTRQLP